MQHSLLEVLHCRQDQIVLVLQPEMYVVITPEYILRSEVRQPKKFYTGPA